MIRRWLLQYQMKGEMKIPDKRVVYGASGAAVTLTGSLTSGGEGELFGIEERPDYCAKLFYEKRLTVTLFQKVAAMVANPPDAGLTDQRESHGSVVLAWPQSLLFDSPLGSRNFIGYTMSLIDTGLFREAHFYYDPRDRIREFGGAFSWRYLLTAAYNIATVTDDIHRHGHCVADFSGRNILIARTAAVAVIDCDSFQVRDATSGRVFPSGDGTGEYLPPELQGLNFSEVRRDRYPGDLFGLAVMIFKLLMGGVHPFQSGGEGVSAFPGIEQKIQNGVFAFDAPDEMIYPPAFAPDYHIIPPSIRGLFSRCFVAGIREPRLRPSAGEWKECLLSEIMAMKHCKKNANHWFGGHLLECPWCGQGGDDLFPAENPHQVSRMADDMAQEADTVSDDGAYPSPSAPLPPSFSAASPPLSSVPEQPLSAVSPGAVSRVPDTMGDVVDPVDSVDTVADTSGADEGEGTELHTGQDTPSLSVIAPAIHVPEPHVTMHDVARNITIPCRFPVSVTGDGPLLVHVTADVPWIEIAESAVPLEGDGQVHVTLNTGKMDRNGFQKGHVLLQAGDVKGEIFLFVSVLPEF